jgi:outer membrane protein
MVYFTNNRFIIQGLMFITIGIGCVLPVSNQAQESREEIQAVPIETTSEALASGIIQGASRRNVVVKPLTLADAVRTTLVRNRQLGTAFHVQRAAEIGVYEARAPFFPSISYQSTLNKSESEFYDFDMGDVQLPPEFQDSFDFNNFGFTGDIYTNQFVLQQLIYDRRVIGNLKLAKLQELATEWQYRGQKQDAVYQTVAAYLEVLRAQELLEVQRQRLNLATRQLETAERNFEVGMRIRTDVLRAQLSRSSAQRDVVSAQIAVERAQANLNRIIGVELEDRHALVPRELVSFDPPSYTSHPFNEINQLFVTATENHPSVQVAALLVEQNQESVDIAQGDYYPTVSATGAWGFRDEGGPNFDKEEWSLTLQMSVPIFEGGRRVAQVQRTQAELNAEQKRYEETVRTILNQVEQNTLALQEEDQNLELAQEAVLVALENYDRFLNLYQEGLADTLEVTEALTELVEAQTTVITTRYNYLSLFAQLLASLGIIPVEAEAYTDTRWLYVLE